MDSILALLSTPEATGAIAGAVAAIALWLVKFFSDKIKAYVLKTENKVDDALLDAILKALEDKKPKE
jgi:hypothetical protein